MKANNIAFGPLTIRFSGRHPATAHIEDEFRSARSSAAPNDDPDIEFVFSFAMRSRPLSAGASRKRRLFSQHIYPAASGTVLEYRLRGGPLIYRVVLEGPPSALPGRQVEIQLPRWTGGTVAIMLSSMIRLATRDGSDLSRLIAKNLIYEIIDPLIWLKLLQIGGTLVHASGVVDRNGEATVFASTGGVGKSTTLLNFMQDARWLYLADDLLIVTSDGSCWRHPKRLQIYAYNVELVPAWAPQVKQGMPRWFAIWWRVRRRVLGASQVRRRLSATDLFGSARLADRGQLEHFVWLRQHTGKDVTVSSLALDVAAQLATNAFADEVWEFLQLLNLSGLGGQTSALATSVLEESRAIVRKALSAAELKLIQIPPESLSELSQIVLSPS